MLKERPARLVILGEGECRAELEQLCRQLQLTDSVYLAGFVSNPYPWMHRADLFVLSSRGEALPTALIEALACGCPVTAMDCPNGPSEILLQGEHGILVPMEDPSALCTGMRQMLEKEHNPEQSRQRGQSFSFERAARQYMQLFQQVAGHCQDSAVDGN